MAIDLEEYLIRNVQYFPAYIDSECTSYAGSSGYCCFKAIVSIEMKDFRELNL